jgi:hypothetical protein
MAGMDLGKQIGPLPLGAWIAVVGGGLAIAYWQRNAGSGEEPEIVEDVSGDEGVGAGPGQFVPVTPVPSDSDNAPEYASNEAWGQAAVNWLIAQGYSPGLASSAITKALAGGVDVEGNKMSIQEWSLWSLALTHLGSPPYPVYVAPPTNVPGPVTPPQQPPPNDPPPSKPPTNKVPPYHEVIAKRGDSISKIAARYGKDWRTVWNFNLKYRSPATVAILKARGPNLIFAGTRIWVPK